MPLGFEANGAWGPAAEVMLREVAELAHKNRDAEQYGWTAMDYTTHWRQRIGCILDDGARDAEHKISCGGTIFHFIHTSRDPTITVPYIVVRTRARMSTASVLVLV